METIQSTNKDETNFCKGCKLEHETGLKCAIFCPRPRRLNAGLKPNMNKIFIIDTEADVEQQQKPKEKVQSVKSMLDGKEIDVKVGDGATRCGWTDRDPYTVIKICTANKIIVQEDKSEQNPEFKAEWVTGGFAGHMVNNEDQKWIITPDPNGKVVELRKHKDGRWYHAGTNFVLGYRRKFYDYNF